MGSAKLKYKVVNQLSSKYSIKRLCAILGVSYSGYFAWKKYPNGKKTEYDLSIATMIKEYQETIKYSYGYRRITIWLNSIMGIKINHKAVLRIMNKYTLCSHTRCRRKTVHTAEAIHKYENRLKRDFIASEKNTKWSTDITQMRGTDGIIYLSALKDLYDGSILGYAYSTNAKTPLVIETVKQAIKRKKGSSNTIIHSDLGCQYTSHEYYLYLEKNNIKASMSRPGTPIDNSPIESFFSTLKTEWIRNTEAMTISEIAFEIDEFISFYNNERIQLKTKKAPAVVRASAA